jgi:hypothetical protein
MTVASGTGTVSGKMSEYKIGTNCCFSGNLRVDADIWYGYSQLEEGPTGRNGRKFLRLLRPAVELCGMSEDGTRACLGPEVQRARPEGTRIRT